MSSDGQGVHRSVRVVIGPVPAESVLVWAETAQRTIGALRDQPEVGVPHDVLEAFERYVAEWRALAVSAAVFRWVGEVDVGDVRRLASYWALLVNIARTDDHPAGVEPAPPAAQPFYDALVSAMAEVLSVDDTDRFVETFEEVVPPFDARAPGAHGPSSPGDQRTRVLIVDDTEDIRLLFRVALQSQPDIEVCGEAANGQEAIDAVAAGCPDAVLLDVMMPVMDGLTALPLLVERCPDARIVIITSAASPALRAEALSRGAHAVVDKETSMENLKRMLVAR